MFTKTTQSEQHEVVDPEVAKRRLAALREEAKEAKAARSDAVDNVVRLTSKRV